jgi:hypothetical protein
MARDSWCDSLATHQIYFSALWDRPGFATLAVFSDHIDIARRREGKRGKNGGRLGRVPGFPFLLPAQSTLSRYVRCRPHLNLPRRSLTLSATCLRQSWRRFRYSHHGTFRQHCHNCWHVGGGFCCGASYRCGRWCQLISAGRYPSTSLRGTTNHGRNCVAAYEAPRLISSKLALSVACRNCSFTKG